jgi:D-hydroxyproline dehydrogenase subunit gamma
MRDEPTARLRITVDGKAVDVADGATVAAALVAHAGIKGTRLSVSGMPRAPLCGIGVCQECRVTVDSRAHVLACQTLCRDGQIIETARPR